MHERTSTGNRCKFSSSSFRCFLGVLVAFFSPTFRYNAFVLSADRTAIGEGAEMSEGVKVEVASRGQLAGGR